jgi:hypothetical protein
MVANVAVIAFVAGAAIRVTVFVTGATTADIGVAMRVAVFVTGAAMRVTVSVTGEAMWVTVLVTGAAVWGAVFVTGVATCVTAFVTGAIRLAFRGARLVTVFFNEAGARRGVGLSTTGANGVAALLMSCGALARIAGACFGAASFATCGAVAAEAAFVEVDAVGDAGDNDVEPTRSVALPRTSAWAAAGRSRSATNATTKTVAPSQHIATTRERPCDKIGLQMRFRVFPNTNGRKSERRIPLRSLPGTRLPDVRGRINPHTEKLPPPRRRPGESARDAQLVGVHTLARHFAARVRFSQVRDPGEDRSEAAAAGTEERDAWRAPGRQRAEERRRVVVRLPDRQSERSERDGR